MGVSLDFRSEYSRWTMDGVHDFRWRRLGPASRFLSSIGKSGQNPAGDFYLLIARQDYVYVLYSCTTQLSSPRICQPEPCSLSSHASSLRYEPPLSGV